MRTFRAGIAALAAVAALAACGGSDGDGDDLSTTIRADNGPCSGITEVEVGPVSHVDTDLTAADFATNPPTWGDHYDPAIDAGTFYTTPPPFGLSVHFLEHGAVIGWTNDLSPEDQRAVEAEFNEIFQDGYYQVAVVENPELEVPFALSAWGAMQTCDKVHTSAIRPFVEEWYASPKSPESVLACEGDARRLPPC